jgi:hypothetical protein
MIQYYFISYTIGNVFSNVVTTIHPFIWQSNARNNFGPGFTVIVVNWIAMDQNDVAAWQTTQPLTVDANVLETQ